MNIQVLENKKPIDVEKLEQLKIGNYIILKLKLPTFNELVFTVL